MHKCKVSILVGQITIFVLRTITFGAELWTILTLFRIINEHSQKLSESCGIQVFHIIVFSIVYVFDIAITGLIVT